MRREDIIFSLIKISNTLDEIGLFQHADKLDDCSSKANEGHHGEDSYMFKPQVSSSIKRLQRILSELEKDGERKMPDWMESYMSTIDDRVTSIHDAFFERY